MIFNSIINLCKKLVSKKETVKEQKHEVLPDGCDDWQEMRLYLTSPIGDSIKNEQVFEPIKIKIHKPLYEYAHGKKFKSTPKWITIHYTGCANISAKDMCRSMKNNTSASSHFYIDEKDIYAAVPLLYTAWHVGAGQCSQPDPTHKKTLKELSTYKAKDWRYDLSAQSHLKWIDSGDDFTGNKVSFGVDICVRKKSVKTKKATDADWYFKDEAVDNLAKVVAYLAKEYSIDEDHVITHCMASGKLCPRPFVSILKDESNDEEWYKFKKRVAEYMKHDIIVDWI